MTRIRLDRVLAYGGEVFDGYIPRCARWLSSSRESRHLRPRLVVWRVEELPLFAIHNLELNQSSF
jgi:hypothetical protein